MILLDIFLFRIFPMKPLLKYIFILLSTASFSQQSKIDSLFLVLKTAKEDTNKVNALNALALSLFKTDPDTSILLSKEAIAISQKTNFRKGEAEATYQIACAYGQMGNYFQALNNYFKTVTIKKEINDRIEIANCDI